MPTHTSSSRLPPVLRLLSTSALALLTAVSTFSAAMRVSAQPNTIRLLEPVNPSLREITPQPGLSMFYQYFNATWPWVLGSAAGIAVLWALIGGIQIMLSGDNTGMRSDGTNRLLWALAGLLIIGLAGVILSTLNPLAYQQVP